MSTTFKSPPWNDSFLLPHCIQFHTRESPNHPLFVYGDAYGEVNVVTWSKAAQAFERAGRIITSLKNADQEGEVPQVFGILASLDSLTYYTLAAGILMSGCTAFLISTRNSPAAISHLLKTTRTHKLFVSADEQMHTLDCTSVALALKDGHHVETLPAPTMQDLFPENGQDKGLDHFLVYPKRHLDSPAFIMHSSGSTAFPKPVIMSHRMVMGIGKSHSLGGVDMDQVRFSVHALPVFHAMAFHPFISAAYKGISISFFTPKNPPMIPSPQSVLDAAVACKSTFLFCVPVFIELWSRSAEDVEKLKLLDCVVYAGGPLNKAIGDELSRGGVALSTLYGMTEIGPACKVIAKEISAEWDWFHARDDMRTLFLPQEGDPDIFEIVFMEMLPFTPAVFNLEVNGKRAFASNDLIIRHPTDPTKFKIYGRKDDQIMLSTGEKTNPGPIETIICRHPFVQNAVMFGRGRIQNGIIIQPTTGHEIDPMDAVALAQFRNEIWPSIEESNAFAPSHSRIYKEMIIVTHPLKPFEMTAKLTPRRPTVLETYKNEMEEVYVAAETSAQTGIPPPSEWTPEQVLDFIRDTVQHIMDARVGDDDDIFVQGGDSLKATYIRNSLVQALRQAHKGPAGGIAQAFVYSNPSITRLATQLSAISGSTSLDDGDEVSSKLEEIEKTIAEFSGGFPQHRPSISHTSPPGEVVFLTGTTGALGAQLLAHLASLPDISHVYAFNRAASAGRKTLRERQIDAFTERGLDVEIIHSSKVTLIEGDTAVRGLGVEPSLFEEICNSITLIIHNAWRVNFNLALNSFRPFFQGVRNLVDLVLHSPKSTPPRLMFMGSVSVFRNYKAPGRPLEASIDDPKVALGSGYSESKFVAERILENAAVSTPFRPIIIRIGQITSNSSGAWNPGDWVPALVRSGQILGALPVRDDSVSWLGLDIAAKAIVEFRNGASQYLHLEHPNPTPWKVLFSAFSSSLGVPLVGWTEWLSRLQKDKAGPETNPAVQLLDFFLAYSPAAVEHMEAQGAPLLDLTQALASSSTLASPQLPALGCEDAQRWVRYWKGKGFLSV